MKPTVIRYLFAILAVLALMALNMLRIDDVSKAVEVNRTFEPNEKNKGLYDEMFGRFVEIYTKNKPVWGKMNK